MKEISFESGAVLVVDKPLNWTSFDVVKKIRYTICKQFNLKKIIMTAFSLSIGIQLGLGIFE